MDNHGLLDRKQIVSFLAKFAEDKSYVNAMWLEGADGIGKVDEYSDIDIWFDAEKSHQESFLYECINHLQELGKIDSRVDNIREEIAQSNIHLANASEYLTIDLCVQSHEVRGKNATCFTKGDIAELPLIIFDKSNVITFKDRIPVSKAEIKKSFWNSKNRILQASRVKKYIKRKQYLEAYLKYIDNIADPLVRIARLAYLPEHYDYGLCHISDHLPREAVDELAKLYQVSSLKDIEEKLVLATNLLDKYSAIIQDKYQVSTQAEKEEL